VNTAGTWSLRSRLTWLLIAISIVAWAASSAWLYRSAVAEADRLFDAALVETAHAVLTVADREIRGREHASRRRESDAHDGDGGHDDGHDIELARIDHAHDEHVVYQVRRRDSAIVYRSPGAPTQPLAEAAATDFSETDAAGTAYRVFSLRAGDEGATIHVGQPLADRVRLARASALRLVLPGAVLVLALVVGVGLVVRQVTQPVVRFSQSIDALQPAEPRKVAHDGLPRELSPVVRALDRLLERVQAALRHERTLTADAAHELRTPLAALRAQAQVALRATDAAERAEALQALMAGVDRATHLVNAVMTLARLDARETKSTELPVTDLAAVVRLVLEELAPAATARGIEVTFEPATDKVRGDADALAILVRNLVDNALRHARSRVDVTIKGDDKSVRIVVSDDGPGVPAEMSQRVFDRFFRAGASDTGAGLGLSLAQRVVELHAGSIMADRAPIGGARFTVTFPV
jgi:signal transduction histidine kinase